MASEESTMASGGLSTCPNSFMIHNSNIHLVDRSINDQQEMSSSHSSPIPESIETNGEEDEPLNHADSLVLN